MFQRFKADHHVHGGVGQGNRGGAALKEGDPVPGVFLGGVGHGFRGNVHAGDVRGGLRQNMRAVAFAGGDIQDALAGDEARSEKIAVVVFGRNFSLTLGDKTFSCELHDGS